MSWPWHQLDHMQRICTLLQTDSHVSTSLLKFLWAGCPSHRPTNSVKALKEQLHEIIIIYNYYYHEGEKTCLFRWF